MFITKKSTLSTLSAFLLYTAFARIFGLLRPEFVGAFDFEDNLDEFIEFSDDYPRGISLFGPMALSWFFLQDIPRACFEFEGEQRCYFSYIPDSCKDNFLDKPRPLVVDVHPLTGNPLLAAIVSGWKKIAEKECLVMMWPSGTSYSLKSGHWNIQGGLQSEDYGTEGGNNVTTASCCFNFRFDPTEGPDDPSFLKKAIDHLVDAVSKKDEFPVVVDESRIYMTGHSNGGIAVLAMAALYSDTIAAAAVFAGMLGTPFAENYSGVPIWMVHGTDDNNYPYEGIPTFFCPPGPGIIFKPTPNVGVWSMDQTVEYLSKQNQCSGKNVTRTTGGNITRFVECEQGASVELLTLDGVGHRPYNFPIIGQTKLPTTQMAWEFLNSHSKSATTDSGADSGAKPSTGSEL